MFKYNSNDNDFILLTLWDHCLVSDQNLFKNNTKLNTKILVALIPEIFDHSFDVVKNIFSIHDQVFANMHGEDLRALHLSNGFNQVTEILQSSITILQIFRHAFGSLSKRFDTLEDFLDVFGFD